MAPAPLIWMAPAAAGGAEGAAAEVAADAAAEAPPAGAAEAAGLLDAPLLVQAVAAMLASRTSAPRRFGVEMLT